MKHNEFKLMKETVHITDEEIGLKTVPCLEHPQNQGEIHNRIVD